MAYINFLVQDSDIGGLPWRDEQKLRTKMIFISLCAHSMKMMCTSNSISEKTTRKFYISFAVCFCWPPHPHRRLISLLLQYKFHFLPLPLFAPTRTIMSLSIRQAGISAQRNNIEHNYWSFMSDLLSHFVWCASDVLHGFNPAWLLALENQRRWKTESCWGSSQHHSSCSLTFHKTFTFFLMESFLWDVANHTIAVNRSRLWGFVTCFLALMSFQLSAMLRIFLHISCMYI